MKIFKYRYNLKRPLIVLAKTDSQILGALTKEILYINNKKRWVNIASFSINEKQIRYIDEEFLNAWLVKYEKVTVFFGVPGFINNHWKRSRMWKMDCGVFLNRNGVSVSNSLVLRGDYYFFDKNEIFGYEKFSD